MVTSMSMLCHSEQLKWRERQGVVCNSRDSLVTGLTTSKSTIISYQEMMRSRGKIVEILCTTYLQLDSDLFSIISYQEMMRSQGKIVETLCTTYLQLDSDLFILSVAGEGGSRSWFGHTVWLGLSGCLDYHSLKARPSDSIKITTTTSQSHHAAKRKVTGFKWGQQGQSSVQGKELQLESIRKISGVVALTH
ncbi:hypothetical protein PoB_007519800 [Plakobranchus ocellatus]|uniref:Uncharacterized protein n=1 Tax=Plakobranchus ocellatus TaxID=259542 RepID=A0AAV4DWQ0_9GAST|nr:hypothetical protein PoB_007519800 [Plakobranchus ocellatus]